jgi:hypothetical protein
MVELKDVSTQECEEKLRKNPASFVFSRLADCYRKGGDIQQAIEVCTRGLADHPDSITGHIILGRCFLEQEKYKEASIEFVKVIEQDRRNQVALKMLADIYAHQDMKEKAGDLYGFLLTIDPENQSIVNLAAASNGSGLTNIYRILGFAEPEQPKSANESSQKDDIFSASPQRAQQASPFDSQEAFAQTIQMDPDELKKEAAQQDSSFSRTMKFDTEELNPAQQLQESGVEEVVGDLPISGDDSVTGDDISARMSMMFQEEMPVPEIASEPKVKATQFDDRITGESAEAGPDEHSDSMEPSGSMPEVSGSDISQRIEQLFGESFPQEPSKSITESSGDYTQVFDASTANTQGSAFSGTEKPFDDGAEEMPSGLYQEQQSDVSGEDIVSRMSEMFGKSVPGLGQPENLSDTEETIAPNSENASQRGRVSEAEETLAGISENAGLIAGESESAISPDNGLASGDESSGISDRPSETGTSELDDMLQEGAISGDDIARRLETIFEEEELASSLPLSPPATEGNTDLYVSTEPEPTASDTISFEENELMPATPQAPETMVVPDISSDDIEPFIDEMPVDSVTRETDTPVAITQEPEQEPKQGQEDLHESLDDAMPAEEAPGMSGDDVRTRLDEIFPDALISEETLSMVDEIPDGEKDEEKPNQGFYTMSGDDAVGASSDDALLKQLDEVVLEAPPHVKDLEMRQELPERGYEPEKSAVSVEEAGKSASHFIPGKPDDDRLNAIPDHVLTPTLADIYFQQGQPHLAVQIYSRLLNKDPENEKIAKRLEHIKQFITDNPQLYSPVTEDLKTPAKAAVRKQPKKPATLKTARKRPLATPKPLAGVRLKKKKK